MRLDEGFGRTDGFFLGTMDSGHNGRMETRKGTKIQDRHHAT